MWYDDRQERCRWLAYFDLLGTRALIQQGRMGEVHNAYTRAIAKISGKVNPEETGLHRLWFSDTFIIIADDDGGPSFARLEQLARLFIFGLILNEVPVRGAISCGLLYENRNDNVLFGPGLVEAHDYGEDQDWIGLVLAPSAEERLANLDLPASERLDYAQFSGSRHRKLKDGDRLYACILGNSYKINGQNPLLEKLHRMRASQSDPRVVEKYNRTCEFLRLNRRQIVGTFK